MPRKEMPGVMTLAMVVVTTTMMMMMVTMMMMMVVIAYISFNLCFHFATKVHLFSIMIIWVNPNSKIGIERFTSDIIRKCFCQSCVRSI